MIYQSQLIQTSFCRINFSMHDFLFIYFKMKAATVLIKTDRLHAVIFGMNTLKEKKKGTIITVFAAIVLGCMYANHKCKNFISDTSNCAKKMRTKSQ